jgi:hypothetical protein
VVQDEATQTTLSQYVDTLLDIRLNDDGGRVLTDNEMIALCSDLSSFRQN